MSEIYLAGGCFWGMQGYFDKINGIIKTSVGYANGKSDKASYETLKTTDHAETLHIIYDNKKISLNEILAHFFRVINPYSINKQGNDIGRQYRSGIYFSNANDEKIIKNFIQIKQNEDLSKKIAVEIESLKNFIQAEDYHQKYLEKNPNGYCHIDLSLASKPLHDNSKFKVPSKEELKLTLQEQTYKITQEKGTEIAGSSKLNKHYEKGIYIDKITKQPLFASSDKFDSGTGWPSFTKPITSNIINYELDTSFGMKRTQISSSLGNTHLGHVFDDGPKEEGGLRYCINGESLEFIPFDKMDELGYGEYKIYVK